MGGKWGIIMKSDGEEEEEEEEIGKRREDG